ncbi:MAG: hypothetical protein KTR16_17265 [Acidiferrobacterales bacterium]|nr:hypothetical protein [Acidiferrobacterales bacterium]
MIENLEKRLAYCLFTCRLGVFIVFLVWTYNKLVRPEHGVHMMGKFYFIPGLSEAIILAFSVFELIMCFLLLVGLYKRFVRAFFLFLSILAVAVPQVIQGYINAILVQAHPTILYFTGFCLLACAITIYVLRDYDTLFSIKTKNA